MGGSVSAAPGNKGWLYHPDYPDDWKRCPLYSLAQWVNGLAFRDIQFSAAGLPVIKIAEIKGGISGQTKFTEQTFDESVRVRPGDLLFSWSGQPETSIDGFWWRGPEGWLNQHVFRVTPAEGIDPTFFYYLLRYLKPNFVGIARNKQTTGLGHVTKRDLENIEGAYPEPAEQRAIAHILGTLDDKIELNRRMSETLEAMARALFKSWFVEFDPVRAKAEGRDPGLPKPLADLFPARLVDSELGEIPGGWEVGRLGDLVELLRDQEKGLAADCVCFANAAGGRLQIGIEDDQTLPPSGQTIDEALLLQLRKRIGELTVNVQVAPRIVTAENGGQFIDLYVARSVGVASTSGGRFYLRVGDTCQLLVGDEVMRLMDERPAQPWETLATLDASLRDADDAERKHLLRRLRESDRVKQDVKEKSDSELLSHYGLAREGRLTNLGVLLIGTPHDRARLGTAPLVQAIRYDERGDKVNKWSWDDYRLSPVELVDAIWSAIPDFRESHELADGLYRQHVPAYDERVVRELLVNALVHRPYTQRGDIYLNLHPDRLEVVNPGRLPLGVTPRNILHQSRRRNDRLATIFHDLRLMEREGTGFDLMYDIQLSQGRPAPVAKEGADSVCVTVQRRIVKPAVIKLLADVDARYQLRRRERITLGLLAMSEGMTARQLSTALELDDGEPLKPWLGRLPELGLLRTSGRTQGTRYYVAPLLLRSSGLEERTTLARIEPHRLEALALEDLMRYPGSSSSEVNLRIAPEITTRVVRGSLERLKAKGLVRFEGDKRWRRYWAVKTE